MLPKLEEQYRSNKASIGQGMPNIFVGNNAPVQETFDNNSGVIGAKADAENIRKDSRERVNSQLSDIESKLSENEGYIDISKGNIEKGNASLQGNHENARKSQEQEMQNEIVRQNSLDGSSKDELTKRALDVEAKGVDKHGY